MALFIFQICFFDLGWIWIENNVFAEENQEASIEAKAQQKVDTLSFVQKMIYVLIYPMLVVAGTLVDNSMVYWEFFHFDVVLWELWIVMRNLANFTLWFIFIYKIFKYLIWDQKSWEIKKLLISLLIAWIWIQASWFIMAALIDMSTILTYWVWWLPITVLKENEDKKVKWMDIDPERAQTAQDYGYLPGDYGTDGPTQPTNERWWELSDKSCTDKDSKEKYNPYVYKTLITVDVKEEDTAAIRTYLTNTTWETHKYISECASFKYTWGYEILVGPSVIYYDDAQKKEYKPTEGGVCHYGGQVYQFAEGLSYLSNEFRQYVNCEGEEDCKERQRNYKAVIDAKISQLTKKEEIIEKIAEGHLLEEWNAHAPWGIYWALRKGQYDNCEWWLDVDNQIVWEEFKTQRLEDTLDDKSYLWVFTQLYSSLMNSGKNILGSTGDSWFLNLLAIVLELWHLIAISIPLIVVGIIFMVRIGILWVAIIISPFIAILTAFEDDIGKFVFDKEKSLKYFKLTTLLWIIFSPAVICLAISLSTVFVTIIANIDLSKELWSDQLLWWLIRIDLWGVAEGVWRFIKAIIWAAITWYILWAAIQSSKLWEMKFVDSLKKLAETSIWTIPVIPVPTKDGWVQLIWANTAFGLNGNPGMISEMANQITREFKGQEAKGIDALFGNWKSEEDAAKDRLKTYTERITWMIPQGDWTTQTITIWEKWSKKEDMTFGSLNDNSDKESVIKAINDIPDATKRKAFGDTKLEVNIWENSYIFRKNAKDKEWKDVVVNKYMTDKEYDDYLKNNNLTPVEWSWGNGSSQ